MAALNLGDRVASGPQISLDISTENISLLLLALPCSFYYCQPKFHSGLSYTLIQFLMASPLPDTLDREQS